MLRPWWKWKWYLLSRVQLFGTSWTVGLQVPLSMGFSRQKYWSGLSFPSPWNEKPCWRSLINSCCFQTLFSLVQYSNSSQTALLVAIPFVRMWHSTLDAQRVDLYHKIKSWHQTLWAQKCLLFIETGSQKSILMFNLIQQAFIKGLSLSRQA